MTSYNLQTLNALCSFIIRIWLIMNVESFVFLYVFYLAFLVFHVCKFNIIIKYNKIKWNKTFIVLIVRNSYLSRFPDHQAIILAVSLCKSDWFCFIWFCYWLFWFSQQQSFYNRFFLNLNKISDRPWHTLSPALSLVQIKKKEACADNE